MKYLKFYFIISIFLIEEIILFYFLQHFFNFNPYLPYLNSFSTLPIFKSLLLLSSVPLNIVLSILNFCFILLIVYNLKDSEASKKISILLIVNPIFLFFSLFVTPLFFDSIFFLYASYFYFKGKFNLASINILLLMYSHSVGLFYYMVFLIYSLLYKKEFLKYLLYVGLASLPIVYFAYLNIIHGVLNLEGLDFSLFYLLYALPLTLFIIRVIPFKKIEHQKDLNNFFNIWILIFLPFVIIDTLRWCVYITTILSFKNVI
jgi:hypothetical protein